MNRILALIGPTAVGKTELSVELAERLGAEIVSADSRQIYKRLTVGTAKPEKSVLERVPHHFINERNLSEPYSAGQFAAEASDRIEQIIARDRCPIVVGGSTLYIEALLHGLSDIPRTSEKTRNRLMRRLQDEGSRSLFEELCVIDPLSAATMDPTKTQRVVRALEVYRDTGRPLSWYHTQRPTPRFQFAPIVLNRARQRLYERINRRVDQMLKAGLIDENRNLLETASPQINALRTIGYREPMAYLRGEMSYTDMVQTLKQNSRRYAKRQLTWFRRHKEYRWIDLSDCTDPIDRILDLVQENHHR